MSQKMYAKIENATTKMCSVGLGNNEDFYKSIGMHEMDVEQAYDGVYYLKGYAPLKPEPTAKELITQKEGEIETLATSQSLRDIPVMIFYEKTSAKYQEAKEYFDAKEAKKNALKAEISKLKGI